MLEQTSGKRSRLRSELANAHAESIWKFHPYMLQRLERAPPCRQWRCVLALDKNAVPFASATKLAFADERLSFAVLSAQVGIAALVEMRAQEQIAQKHELLQTESGTNYTKSS